MDGNTINAVIELLSDRHKFLFGLAQECEGEGKHLAARHYKNRAYELECAMGKIEQAHAETPSSKAA